MKKILLGAIIGATLTVYVQTVYKKNPKFRNMINNITQGAPDGNIINPDGGTRAINLFDRLSLIYQRLRR
jgi:hypothetical protein